MIAALQARRPFALAVAAGLALGAAAGGGLGFAAACAKLLGDAEVHPPNALPPAPVAPAWSAAGAGLGAGAAARSSAFGVQAHRAAAGDFMFGDRPF